MRLSRLAQRRALLVAESNLQRSNLIAQTHQIIGYSLAVKSSVGAIGNVAKRLKGLPIWVNVAIGGLMLAFPKQTMSLAKSGLSIWKVWRQRSNPDIDF